MERKFQDVASVEGTRRTSDGYLVADVLCARTGVQEYCASDLGLWLYKDPVISVYRPESAVFDKSSLGTYAHKPVTLGHPIDNVDPDNWKEHAVGDIGDEIARDGDFVRVSIKVMDGDAIKAIENGTREISMGYSTPIRMEDGVTKDGQKYQAVQTGPIKINHLAIVDQARGGSKLRIGDNAKSWGTAPTTTKAGMKGENMTLRTIVVDGLSVETTDQGAQAIEKLTKALADANVQLKSTQDSLAAQVDDLKTQLAAKDGELTAATKALKDATSDEKLSEMVRERVALVGDAKAFGLDIDASCTDSNDQIRRRIVAKHLGDEANQMNDSQVEGAFAFMKRQNKGAASLSNGIQSMPSNPRTVADAAFAKRLQKQQDAWKGVQ
jgi:hypothetical protein